MLNNLGPAFKNHPTVINDRIRKEQKLGEEEVLFKAIEEEETRIVAEQKISANFVTAQSHYSHAENANSNTSRFGYAGMQKMSVIKVKEKATFLDFTICTSPLTKNLDQRIIINLPRSQEFR